MEKKYSRKKQISQLTNSKKSSKDSKTDHSKCLDVFIDNKLLWKNVVEVPFEALTVQTFSEFNTVGNIASIFILHNNKHNNLQFIEKII